MARENWGEHLILDLTECNDNMVNPEFLANWVKQLVKDIDMVAYGEPQVIHFGKGDPKLAGYTVLQFIETSNILMHSCDDKKDCYLDVFSCKPFDASIVIKSVQDNFAPKHIDQRFFTRGVIR